MRRWQAWERQRELESELSHWRKEAQLVSLLQLNALRLGQALRGDFAFSPEPQQNDL